MGDVFEDEVPTVTMQEFIDGVEAQELEADLVLGGDEGKECTYPKVYMTRQAIFSCLTCAPAGNAGVCTACSLTCHDGHEIIELWTRRQFRCDCGNSKFGGILCKLIPEKDPENTSNAYNQNYKGLYCTCHRPFPDPDGEDQGEMIQCCICEDWFHENHLGLSPTEHIPRDDEGEPIYEDFVCQTCAVKCSFLALYKECLIEPSVVRESASTAEGTKETEDCSTKIMENGRKAVSPSEETVNVGDGSIKGDCKSSNMIIDAVKPCYHIDSVSDKVSKSAVNGVTAVEASNCSLPLHLAPCDAANCKGEQETLGIFKGARHVYLLTEEQRKPLFIGKGWREHLCRCDKCHEFLVAKKVSFLLDKGDTLEEYEKIAKQRRAEKLQKQEGEASAFLQNLGHVQQIELINGINDMKNELEAFLGAKDESTPITDADIKEIFENLRRKRQRLV